jgi:hypothetical protein
MCHWLFEMFDQYVYVAESPLVPECLLVPHTDLRLQCSFVKNIRCEFTKRFHDDCVPPSAQFWPTFHVKHCAIYDEVIAT